MNKTEALFIRACKSKEPEKRLISLYRRLYLYDEDFKHIIIANNLMEIADKYCPMRLTTLANDSNFRDTFYCQDNPDERSHWERISYAVCKHIRFSEASKFEGLPTPTWAKNKYGK